MDFRKVKKGMVVRYYSGWLNEYVNGTITRVFIQNGMKFFEVTRSNGSTFASHSTESKESSKHFDFKTGQYKQDFEDLLK